MVEHLEAREGLGEHMDIRMEDIRITGTASVTWPEPEKPQEPQEQAPPEQVEAVNEQEQED